MTTIRRDQVVVELEHLSILGDDGQVGDIIIPPMPFSAHKADNQRRGERKDAKRYEEPPHDTRKFYLFARRRVAAYATLRRNPATSRSVRPSLDG